MQHGRVADSATAPTPASPAPSGPPASPCVSELPRLSFDMASFADLLSRLPLLMVVTLRPPTTRPPRLARLSAGATVLLARTLRPPRRRAALSRAAPVPTVSRSTTPVSRLSLPPSLPTSPLRVLLWPPRARPLAPSSLPAPRLLSSRSWLPLPSSSKPRAE